MLTYLAQVRLPDGTQFNNPTGFKPEFKNLSSIVTLALPLVFSIAGILLLAYMIWGGFDYLTSMGQSEKAEAGKAKITNALIGFVLIFVAYWMVQIVDYLFGLKIYTQ